MNTAENSATDPSTPPPTIDAPGVGASNSGTSATEVPQVDAHSASADTETFTEADASATVSDEPTAPATSATADTLDADIHTDAGDDVASAGQANEESVAVETAAAEPETPKAAPVADDVLLAAVDVARDALLKVTPASTIGAPAGHIVEDDHVLSLLFASTLPGYPGWNWSVTLARVDDGAPQVLETEMMPGENALLAPEWVPWSDRLADYRATQEAAEVQSRILAEAAAELELEDEEEDEDEYSILHAGDVDGVDVDEIDDSGSDDDDESDNDDDDDDGDQSDDDDDDESDDDADDESDDDDDDDESDDDDDDEGERNY